MTEESTEKELLEARQRIVELEAGNKTVLTGSQFLTIILVGPLYRTILIVLRARHLNSLESDIETSRGSAAPGCHSVGAKYI